MICISTSDRKSDGKEINIKRFCDDHHSDDVKMCLKFELMTFCQLNGNTHLQSYYTDRLFEAFKASGDEFKFLRDFRYVFIMCTVQCVTDVVLMSIIINDPLLSY